MTREERAEPEFRKLLDGAGLEIVLRLLLKELEKRRFWVNFPRVQELIQQAYDIYKRRHDGFQVP